jgi:hypothetical protein
LRNIDMKRVLRISLLALLALLLLSPAHAQVSVGISVGTPELGISVGFAPPEIPDYDQPPCPEDGALWVPGYWAWDDEEADYYWIPGTWVLPPQPGLLWTPAYWSWDDGAYIFHDGYWATEVGFYGGINYGFGYYGEGFAGGRWDNDRFMYNAAVVNVNQTVIHNVYVDKTVVVNNTNTTRVSFNGGQGGTSARPTARDQQVAQARHVPPAEAQMRNRQAARSNPQLRASTNQGKPAVAATAKPGDFTAHAVPAKSAGGGAWHPPANPREAAKAHNARPSGDANRQNSRPGEMARPQQNPNPEENARPGENRSQPNAQPSRPNETTRPRQNARPEENPRPPIPQDRTRENPRPRDEQPQSRPEQQRPGQKPNPEQKPKAQQKERDKHPEPKPKEEHPPQL